MADETTRYRIEVVVDPKPGEQGISIVEKRLVGLETAADRLRRLLRNLFFFAGLTASIRQLFDLSDAYTRIENRVRLVTKSDAERTVVLQKLFEVSNRVRTGTEQIAELYVRTALSARTLGKSQQELINFSESVSQALILSGASAQEANAGLIQLSQGISANRLGGDELRSVLEQLPAVADVIAKQLGVTRGELRRMGAEGKISADVILEAFKNAREELAERFANTIPTIGQAFQVLKNRLLEFVGNANTATGASEAISRAVLSVAANIDVLARSVVALSIALGVTLVDSGIRRAIAALRLLSVALLTNPIGLLLSLLPLAVGAFIAFGDQVKVASDQLASLHDFAFAAFDVIGERLAPLIELLKEFAGSIGLVAEDFRFSFEDIVRGTGILVDSVVGLFRGLVNSIVVIISYLPSNWEAVSNLSLFAIRGFTEAAIDLFLALFQTLGDILRKVAAAVKGVIVDSSNSLAAVARGEFDTARQYADLAKADIEGIANSFKGIPDSFKKNLSALKGSELLPVVELTEGAQALGVEVSTAFSEGFAESTGASDLVDDIFDRAEDRARQRLAEERKRAEELRNAQAGLGDEGTATFTFSQSQQELLGQITGQTSELILQMSDLNVLYEQGAITVEQYQRTLDQLTIKSLQGATDMESGFRRAFLAMSLEATNFAAAAEKALGTVADFGTDVLVDLARTGGENFRQLADQAVLEIQRIIARLIIMNLIKAAGNALGGPIGGLAAGAGAGVAGGLAKGGTTQPDRSYLVGEKGPELFRPGQTGSIVPNEALMGSQKPPQVHVQVVNVSDPSEVPAAIDSGGSDRAVINVLSRNKGAVAQILR